MSNSGLDLDRVTAALRTPALGRRLVWRAQVDSTQDEVVRLLEAGAPPGTVVVADSQSAGRGRRGREWIDRPGQDLLFSVALPPGLKPEGLVAVALGAYLAEALSQDTQQSVRLRWPNDLVVGASKVGGILIEVAGEMLVVGVGLNLKGQAAEIAQRTGKPVSTLEAGSGRPLVREDVLVVCLNALGRAYEQLISEDRWPATRKIADQDALRGQPVLVTGPAGVVEGTAVGIALDGALLVRSGSTITEVTVADDITLQAS